MIHVPDPQPLGLDIGDTIDLALFGHAMEPYTVYYVGEYPPPHFEGNYKTDKEWVGKEIYGMRDPRGERHWVFQYAGDECAARQELSRANST